MQSIKEHNLKANHNGVPLWSFRKFSVCNLSKNTIWKQITTLALWFTLITTLYAIYQRTQSESKSQHYLTHGVRMLFCMQSIKEHNLKANHNNSANTMLAAGSVCNLSKNTIWKQITTYTVICFCFVCLYAIYQRTQSESKSQRESNSWIKWMICMQSIKEHNLKANHNRVLRLYRIQDSVCNLSKNTIWKQITTDLVSLCPRCNLYAIYQRTQSESKSQHIWCDTNMDNICMQSIKEHNLKANHNFGV